MMDSKAFEADCENFAGKFVKLYDLPLSETIKYLENIIYEHTVEMNRPENAGIKDKIWDVRQECIHLLKELNAMRDFEVIPSSSVQEANSSDLSCWENDPILLTSHPPKHVWKCRYCGKEVITEVGVMPDRSCECRNTYEKDNEV